MVGRPLEECIICHDKKTRGRVGTLVICFDCYRTRHEDVQAAIRKLQRDEEAQYDDDRS